MLDGCYFQFNLSSLLSKPVVKNIIGHDQPTPDVHNPYHCELSTQMCSAIVQLFITGSLKLEVLESDSK